MQIDTILISIAYILLVLVPINGALYLGARKERIRTRKILMAIWKLGISRGRK